MSVVKTKGKHIKQINYLQIKYLPELKYFVVSPNKEILKYGMELEDAELYCARCKDYIIKKG